MENLSISLPLAPLRAFLTASKKLWSGKELAKNQYNNGLVFTKIHFNPFEKFIAITTGGYSMKYATEIEGNLYVSMPIGIQGANVPSLSEMEVVDAVKKDSPTALLQLEKTEGEIITFTQDRDKCIVTIDGEPFSDFANVFHGNPPKGTSDNFLAYAIHSIEERFPNDAYNFKVPVTILNEIVSNVEQVLKVSKQKYNSFPKSLICFQLNGSEYDLMIDTNVDNKRPYLPGTNYWYSGYSIQAPANATNFCMVTEQLPFILSYIEGNEIEITRYLGSGDFRGLLHVTGTDPKKKTVVGVAVNDKDTSAENAPGVWVDVPGIKKSTKVQMDLESAQSLREYIAEVKANPMGKVNSQHWKI